MMMKWTRILLVLLILASLSFGCAQIAKETKIKCPKCGTIFTVDEGLAAIQMKGY